GTLASIVYVACEETKSSAPTTTSPGAPTLPLPDAGAPAPGTSSAQDSDRVFPQGVASGDPRPDRVVLWTRVEPLAAGHNDADDIQLEYVIARDEALADVVARGMVTASASADHTVR